MGMILNKKALSLALDIDPTTIEIWESWGCPVESLKGGRVGHEYDLGKIFAWRLTRTADGGDTTKERRAKAALEKAEIENMILRGEAIPREQAIQSMAASVSAFKNRIRAMSRKLAPLIAPREQMAEVEKLLRTHIDEALTEIASHEFATAVHRRIAENISGGETAPKPDRQSVGRPGTQTIL
jgi:phage terminase Nu1 subunit (DNA packaging protein)